MRLIAVTALVISIVFLALAATQQSQKIEIPVLPTERDQFGGRPGTFHFVTNEQAMADAAQLQKAAAAVDGIEKKLATLDSATREQFNPELVTLKTFLMDVNANRSRTAGESAGAIEQRLNAAKGKFMCGACHGHGMGMMHGGGMGPMGRQNQQ